VGFRAPVLSQAMVMMPLVTEWSRHRQLTVVTQGAFGLDQDMLAMTKAQLAIVQWQIGVLKPHSTVRTVTKPTNGANNTCQGGCIKRNGKQQRSTMAN